MKSFKTLVLAAAASAAMSGAAFAQDEGPFALSFNVGGSNDYVFRGVSQTDENYQVFGGADITAWEIGYAGIWLSNVDFNDGTDFEYDLYAGVKPTVGPVTLDLGVIYYGYAGGTKGQEYVEFKAGASTAVGPATVGAAVFYSDDFYLHTGEAVYYEANAAVPVAEKFTISGAVGRQTIDLGTDYTTWNLGVGYALNDIVGFDLRYHDTDEHDLGDIYDSRVVLGVKAVF